MSDVKMIFFVLQILDAQKQLEMLEDNKRALSTANPPLSKDNLEYKLVSYMCGHIKYSLNELFLL